MRARAFRSLLAGAGVVLALLLATVAANSFGWIGRTFPGFFVMENRVVPSIALPSWADGDAARLFQHQVLAVDGQPVRDAAAIYAAAEAAGPDRTLHYRLRAAMGAEVAADVTTRTFTLSDYAYLFGAYLLNGLAFCAIGLLVPWLARRDPAGWGLSAATLSTGIFVATATDLYGPYWFVRLHVAAEASMAAAFVHLALVFPTDRLRGARRRVLRWLYAATAVAIVVYESVLWNPTAYTLVHQAMVGAQLLGCLAMIAAIVVDLVRTRSPLVRRRIGVVALGMFAGMVLPAGTWATSAVLGGAASLNWAALTAFFFPVSLAYAVLQADLFEIDVVVRRAAVYVAVVAVTVALYVLLLALFGSVSSAGLGERPALLVALNVGLLFVVTAIRARIQAVVDRVFFRVDYDAQATIAGLGHALERALQVREVVAETQRVLQAALFPRRAALLQIAPDGRLSALDDASPAAAVALPAEFVARLAAGTTLARYAWDVAGGRNVPPVWDDLGAELLVPVRHNDVLDSVMVLGAKESGRPYNVHDSALLKTIAGQVSLALATARAFEDLAALNAGLERQVTDRTAELARANQELSSFLVELNDAYGRLEQSHQSLLRADRLATLGRLAAGIAHEINTPLAAVMNALEVLGGLGREYAESIGDAQVTPDDHRAIAGELARTVDAAQTWATRAATYVGRIKSHGHEPSARDVRRFLLAEVLDEVAALLDHRLRGAGCHLEIDEQTNAIGLLGDPGQLVHLLVNVIDNAIGAYEEMGEHAGRIEVVAREEDDVVVLTVRDHATGIAPAIADRVFEELFTTKERGKGTGLGLWIARNIAERSFAGTLDLMAVDGRGACLCARLRAVQAPAPVPAEVGPAAGTIEPEVARAPEAGDGAAKAPEVVSEPDVVHERRRSA